MEGIYDDVFNRWRSVNAMIGIIAKGAINFDSQEEENQNFK